MCIPQLPLSFKDIPEADPPPSNSDYKGIYKTILGSSYIPIKPLLQGGGSS